MYDFAVTNDNVTRVHKDIDIDAIDDAKRPDFEDALFSRFFRKLFFKLFFKDFWQMLVVGIKKKWNLHPNEVVL